MNIFQMITFAVWETEFLTTFIFILTPVLSSRLLLNLRQVNAAAGAGATSLIINDLYTEDGSAPSTDGNMVTVVPAYETMSFGNLNLDAFDSITNSSPDLESNKKNIVSSHCLSPMHTVDIREASHDSLHTDSTLTPSSIFLGDARSSLELEVFQTRQIQATTSSC
ncbi:hypothetical protein BDW22DRAFT_157980 [Trametopsis cervina]|nr:hypothetical protein BDW22DRAFT_157980 [Trametopsis cervina]